MLRTLIRTKILQNLTKRSSSISAASISPTNENETKVNETVLPKKSSKGSIVAAAFASLKNDNPTISETNNKNEENISEKIINAKTINGLLGIAETQNALSRKNALKIVTILAEWSSINRVKVNEFESDPRFLKVCRILGRTASTNQGKNGNQTNQNNNKQKTLPNVAVSDLNLVLGIAGDDEAAKLVSNISPNQMVKVISMLAQKKRRSTPLLRSIAYNLSGAQEQLDLKQCGDVLYAMASLNFPDEVLLAKISSDILTNLSKNSDKSAVIGSILTSLGMLKYRDTELLESLTDWIQRHHKITRLQDFSALITTLGILNYKPIEPDELQKLSQNVKKEDFFKSSDWLNYVWSLVLLRFANENMIQSVLSPNFINELKTKKASITPTLKMKILNINGFAKSMSSTYSGPYLSEDSDVFNLPLAHNKSKMILVNGLLDALKNLTSKNSSRNLVDSKMGFLIDAECLFDSKRNPISIDSQSKDNIRVALMIVDFHDLCQGPKKSLNGITNLSFDLLEKSGYTVLPIMYNEFNTTDKLLKRVQYLETKFKEIVNRKN